MNDNKKAPSAESLLSKVKAGLEKRNHQKENDDESINEKKLSKKSDFSFEPALSDNPYEDMSVEDIASRFMSEDSLKFLNNNSYSSDNAEEAQEDDLPETRNYSDEEEMQYDNYSDEDMNVVQGDYSEAQADLYNDEAYGEYNDEPVPEKNPEKSSIFSRIFGFMKKGNKEVPLPENDEYIESLRQDLSEDTEFSQAEIDDVDEANYSYNDYAEEQQPSEQMSDDDQATTVINTSEITSATPDEEYPAEYENEEDMSDTMDFDRVDAPADDIVSGIDEKEALAEQSRKLTFDFSKVSMFFNRFNEREEYTSIGQISSIFSQFRKDYNILLIRLGVCFILTIIAFFFENIEFLGGSLSDGLSMRYFPSVHAMISLQLVVLASALIPKQLLSGINGILKKEMNPEGITVIVLLTTLFYDILISFSKNGSGLKCYGFAAILCIFATLIYEFFTLKREIYSFNVIASKKPKVAIAKIDDEQAEKEKQAFNDMIPEDAEFFRIGHTNFIEGFFERLGNESKPRKPIKFLALISLCLDLIFFIVGLFTTKSFFGAMQNGYTALLLTLPFTVFFTYSYPFYRASDVAYRSGSAIIGEESVGRYSRANVVSFNDKDIFPSYATKLKHINTFKNARVDHIIYYMAGIFSKIGGPLCDVFELAAKDFGIPEAVEIIEIENDGIEAIVEGKHIYLGKPEYMRRSSMTDNIKNEEENAQDDISVMYFAADGEVLAEIFVQYMIEPDFEDLLENIYKSGICVGIKTCDPNINDSMLSRRIKISKYPVKVLKMQNPDERIDFEPRINSGIVSKGSSKTLISSLALCEKISSATKSSGIVKIFAIVFGFIISILVSALGHGSGIYSFFVALYQVCWLIPIILITRLSIRK